LLRDDGEPVRGGVAVDGDQRHELRRFDGRKPANAAAKRRFIGCELAAEQEPLADASGLVVEDEIALAEAVTKAGRGEEGLQLDVLPYVGTG
jgi:hypothetical protein